MPNATVTGPLVSAISTQPSSRLSRRHARRGLRVPCIVRVQGSDENAITGRTVNISVSGLAMQCGEKLRVGTNVEIILPTAGDELMSLLGTVVQSRRILAEAFEMGVALCDPTSASQQPTPNHYGRGMNRR